MHWDWNAILSVVVAIAAAVLRAAIVTPKDHDVAAKIRHLADDAAAVIVIAAPKAEWAAKLKAVIDRLSAALPDLDDAVLESAATGALTRLGQGIPVSTSGTGSP